MCNRDNWTFDVGIRRGTREKDGEGGGMGEGDGSS